MIGCEGVDAPPVPDNGYLTDPDFDNMTLYDIGAILAYRCRSGYELNGKNFTICSDEGWMSINISCQREYF